MQRLRLQKMHVEPGTPVRYSISGEHGRIELNDMIGSHVDLSYSGRITCLRCGNAIKKTYADGLCYPCFTQAPEAAECILRPELCRAHLGQGRDPEWERAHHDQPHVVYLALTSSLKIGVTRAAQIPTRWIDQGAWQAVVLARTPYRKIAGDIEVTLKRHVSDRTPWQKMLTGVRAANVDLTAEKQRLGALLPESLRLYLHDDDSVTELRYPVRGFPPKVRSLKLHKQPLITGCLEGIRGQYLIFDGGRVLNVRSHSGYHISFENTDAADGVNHTDIEYLADANHSLVDTWSSTTTTARSFP